MKRSPGAAVPAAVLAAFLGSCQEDIEGNEPLECEDGADNDSDGYFDCQDRDCWGAPACDEGGGDDDDDGGGPDDDDGGGPDDDDDSSPADDDDDSSPADDDDSTGDGETPWIDEITWDYEPGPAQFVFHVTAFDPDEDFGIPLLLWSVDGNSQPPVTVGSVPLQGIATFDVELGGAVAGTTYQVLFAIRDADGNVSDGYLVSATAQ